MKLFKRWAMRHIDPRPIPGRTPKRSKIPWKSSLERTFQPEPHDYAIDQFSQILTQRRSARKLSVVSLDRIANVIRQSLRVSDFGVGKNDGRLRKAVLSAGAIHPIKCVFFRGYDEILVYEDVDDKFFAITPYIPAGWHRFVDECTEVLPQNNGYWLLLFGDMRDTDSLYEQAASLIWRDAGAALQVIAMVSCASDLQFCPAGILGQNGIDVLTNNLSYCMAAGVAAIGGS